MDENAKIETLYDYDTGKPIAPRTVIDAISGQGKKWNYLGFTEDNVLGVIAGTWQCNRNILDNWYFANPVNQRGKTEYTDNHAYTIDRWRLTSGSPSKTTHSLKLEKDGILFTEVTRSANSNAGISQVLEGTFAGETLTFSALVTELTGTLNLYATDSAWTPILAFSSSEPGLLSLSFTVPSDETNDLRVAITSNLAQTVQAKIVACKLELGDQQTLAHKEGDKWVLNEIPDYAAELAKCRRYLLPVLSGPADAGLFGRANISVGSIGFPLDAKQLRASPTIVSTVTPGTFRLISNGSKVGSVKTSDMSLYGYDGISVFLVVSYSGPWGNAENDGHIELDANGQSGTLFLNAEL